MIRYILFISLVLVAAGCGRGKDSPAAAVSAAAVFASVESIAPGRSFTLAVEFTMPPGWHTYAAEPGDSGMPPSIELITPVNLEVGTWRFPAFQTFTDAAGTTYGYEDKVVLLSDVTLPENLDGITVLTLKLDVMWLICRDVCVAESAMLAIDLPVGEHVPVAAAEWQARLQAGRWTAADFNTGTNPPGEGDK